MIADTASIPAYPSTTSTHTFLLLLLLLLLLMERQILPTGNIATAAAPVAVEFRPSQD